MKKKKNDLGRNCPECGDGRLFSVFESKIYDGVEYGDDFLACDSCDYRKKINERKNRNHTVKEE